jgi:hypothetical protein
MHGRQQLPVVLSASASDALAARLVPVADFLPPTVAMPAFRDDGGARLDVVRHEGMERDPRCVLQRRRP